MTATSTDDAARIETLFEHLTGHTPSFHCDRMGRSHHDNICPIIVKFICEDDKREILRHAHKLRGMQAEWPKVNIGPDRTKKQQAHFRLLREKRKEHRLKGERVIIVNDRIVVDKRHPLPHVGDVDATHQHKSHDKHSVDDRRSPSPSVRGVNTSSTISNEHQSQRASVITSSEQRAASQLCGR